MDITGRLKVKGSEQKVSDKFRKRDFVITDNSTQYPQHISFQLSQDRCNLLDDYVIGDEIKVHFNLRGREWSNPQGEVKYFNQLEAWKLTGSGSSQNTSQEEHYNHPAADASNDDSGLPF